MSRSRFVVVGVFGALALLVLAGCSDDEGDEPSSDRGTLTFADPPPGSTDLGLCAAYDIDDMRALIGGEQSFRELAPAAIGAEGDPVTGEVCSWDRTETDGDAITLRVEVRDFGDDADALDDQFDQLEKVTTEAEPVTGVGDAAFAATTEEATLLQVRSGPYLVTAASRSQGDLDPVAVDDLTTLAADGIGALP